MIGPHEAFLNIVTSRYPSQEDKECAKILSKHVGKLKQRRERLKSHLHHLQKIIEEQRLVIETLKENAPQELLRYSDVAKYFGGVTDKTIREWQKKHGFPMGRRIGRERFFTKAEITEAQTLMLAKEKEQPGLFTYAGAWKRVKKDD